MDTEVVFVLAGLVTIFGTAVGVWGVMRNQARANRQEWHNEITRAGEALKEAFRKDLESLEEKLLSRIDGAENGRTETEKTLRDLMDQRWESISSDTEHRINAIKDKIDTTEKFIEEKLDRIENQTTRDDQALDDRLSALIDSRYNELLVRLDTQNGTSASS